MNSREFEGRRGAEATEPVPPGQYVERGFPVLSAGPTPTTPLAEWSFHLEHGSEKLASWSWEDFQALSQTEVEVDIHCVTGWSKLGTRWGGVLIDTLFDAAGIEPLEPYVMAFSDGGYTTNLPVEDLSDGKAMVATHFDGDPLEPEHGGPARLLVPHLYFWKSAKWVRGIRFMATNDPGFWEGYGYHSYGDPWQEQRYAGD